MASIIKVDQIQTAAGGTPTAADLGINVNGNTLQVVRDSIASNISTSSTSYVATGHTVTITPKFANSIILVELKGGRIWLPSSGTQIDVSVAINGDTSALDNRRIASFYADGSTRIHGSVYGAEYFTNVGTSAVTYSVYFKVSSANTSYLNDAGSSLQQTLVATEIAG